MELDGPLEFSLLIFISYVFGQKYFPLDLGQDWTNTGHFPVLYINVILEMLQPDFIHSDILFDYLSEGSQLTNVYSQMPSDSDPNLKR